MTLSSFSSEELHQWKDSITAYPYRSYLYSYPHKTAYQDLQPPIPLKSLWLSEPAE